MITVGRAMTELSVPIDSRSTSATRQSPDFDPVAVRAAFPILRTLAHGKPLIYLDNGATTQKPQAVIDAISRFYAEQNANIHRGVYQLSQVATGVYESARQRVAEFINAAEAREVIFTRGTTEAINLVATSWGRANLEPGGEVLISAMEHHSNIVPWQIACEAAGATLRVIPFNDAGELRLDELEQLLSRRTQMVALVHLSNSLGTINDVKSIAVLAHAVGAKVLVDGAQWVAHFPTDVRDLDVDFYAFSGHKLYGPTGIGVLYGRREILEAMPPYQGGGDMIESVTFEKTVYAQIPNRFEAGTPDIAGAAGLGAAIDYLRQFDLMQVHQHEDELLHYLVNQLSQMPGIRLIGTARNRASVVSFVMEDPPVSVMEAGVGLDKLGIAVRTGHHCCQPVMDRMGVSATVRASLAMYNTRADVDALIDGLKTVRSEARRHSATREKSGEAESNGAAELKFPAAAAPSPAAAADELADIFEMLGERDARNDYLLDIARQLPSMPAPLKTEATRVHGCMSVVHLFGRRMPRQQDRLEFIADSDAPIVRGLIALLQKLYSGQTAAEILSFDVEAFFVRIGLEFFISSQRRNGLAGMVQRIRAIATAILNPIEPAPGAAKS